MLSDDKLPLIQIEVMNENVVELHPIESITDVIETNTLLVEVNQTVLQHSIPLIDKLNIHHDTNVSKKAPDENVVPETVPDENVVPETVPDENVVSETVPDENVVSDTVPDENVVSETVPDENVVSETVPDENVVSETVPDENVVSDTVPDENVVPETVPDENVVPETVPDENVVSDTVPDENVVSETVPDENVVSDNAVSEKAVSETVPDENVVSETVPDENVVSETVPDENVVSETVPDENVVSETVPNENVVPETVPDENVVSEKAVSDKAVSEKAVSEKAVSEKAVSEKAVDHKNSLNVNDKYKMHNMVYNDNILTIINARRLKTILSNITQGYTSTITLHKLHKRAKKRIEKLFDNKISPFVIRKDYSIHKKIDSFTEDIIFANGGEESLFEREVNSLKSLFGYIHFPQLLCVDAKNKHIYMTYSGKELNIENTPNDWKQQIQECLEIFKITNIFHNDIFSPNILVDNNILNIIDFGFSTFNEYQFPFTNITEQQLQNANTLTELLKKTQEDGDRLRVVYTNGFNDCKKIQLIKLNNRHFETVFKLLNIPGL